MKFKTHDRMLDEIVGVKGSPERKKFDSKIDEFIVGNAIRQTRISQNMTQKELGKRMGVKEAQISKIESGKSITFNTFIRALSALGLSDVSLDFGEYGRYRLI